MSETYLVFMKSTPTWDLDSITDQFCDLDTLLKLSVP